MLINRNVFCAFVILAFYSLTPAQNDSDKGRVELPDGLVLRPHAYGHFEAGQIENGSLSESKDAATINGGTGNNYNIDHVWTENAVIELGFNAIYRQHLKMNFSLGAKLYFSYPLIPDQRYTKYLRQDVYFDETYAQYHFGNVKTPLFLAQIGYFKFKYNPDVRNLGEYMFRTGTYPIYFDMSFDAPWKRLLGLNLESNPIKSLKINLLFVTETMYPSMNWSLAGLANYDIANLHFVNIGAGVDFAHLFDVYTDHSFSSFGDPTSPHLYGQNNRQYVSGSDTGWYTFKGTKVMGRISIDPKAFIHWKYFGENDLKLYGEADIIGVKNYPDSGISSKTGTLDLVAPSYNNIGERIPVAVGFNFPTFKTLDVLNLEVEWFGAKYYNDASYLTTIANMPVPTPPTPSYQQPQKSKYKWSVFAKKSFFDGHFALTTQFGRDHMRLPCADYNHELWSELLVENKDWWWVFKTSWMF